MKEELICISCPIGCHLEIEGIIDDESNMQIRGNKCPRGIIYGKEEIFAPKRQVTATVSVISEDNVRLPVKTDIPLLKNQIGSLLDRLYELQLQPPVKMGDVVLENFQKTGVNVIATQSITSSERKQY